LVKPLSASTFQQLNPLPFPSPFLKIHSTSFSTYQSKPNFVTSRYLTNFFRRSEWLHAVTSNLGNTGNDFSPTFTPSCCWGPYLRDHTLWKFSVLLFLPFSNVPSAWPMACSYSRCCSSIRVRSKQVDQAISGFTLFSITVHALLVSCTSNQMCPSYFHFNCTFLQLGYLQIILAGVEANVTGGSWPQNWKERATYSVEVNNWCIDSSWVGLLVKLFSYLHTQEILWFESRSTFEILSKIYSPPSISVNNWEW
jgi:hypothetical protein